MFKVMLLADGRINNYYSTKCTMIFQILVQERKNTLSCFSGTNYVQSQIRLDKDQKEVLKSYVLTCNLKKIPS